MQIHKPPLAPQRFVLPGFEHWKAAAVALDCTSRPTPAATKCQQLAMSLDWKTHKMSAAVYKLIKLPFHLSSFTSIERNRSSICEVNMEWLKRFLIVAVGARECLASLEALSWGSTLMEQGRAATDYRSDAHVREPASSHVSSDEHRLRIERLTAAHGHRVPLTRVGHDRYFANISIGSPGKNYQTLVDTSIPFLWMPNFECGSRSGVEDHSSSQQKILVDRSVCEDDVQVEDIAIENLAFLGSRDMNFSWDGFLGLDYYEGDLHGAKPLFQTMVDQKLLDEQVFAVYMGAHGSDSNELVLGGANSTHYSGDFVRLPVVRDNGWIVDFCQLELGDRSFELDTSGALFDAGTSVINLPSRLADEINEAIGPVECSQRDSLPDLTFTFSGNRFAISPFDYIVEGDDGCESAIVGLVLPDPYAKIAILGTPFLKRWYTVFDLEDVSVHVARAK